MAEKKMTQVKALEIALEVLNEYAALDEQVEAREVIAGMVEKRKAPRPKRENKELAARAERVFEVLNGADEPLTNGEIAEILSDGAAKDEDGYVSIQKAAAAVRKLVADGRVEVHEGEKAKDKKRYSVL